jgi:small nuclear ribonucleoprotein D1
MTLFTFDNYPHWIFIGILFISRGKAPKSYATLSVRGSTMRAWLLPESLNLDALLVDTNVEIHHKATMPQSQTVNSQQQGRKMGSGRGRGRR